MKHIHTFENFLTESGSATVQHKVYPDINGEIIAGPMKFDDLVKKVKNVDMPEADDENVKSFINKPVWIAVQLTDGTILGANQDEFK